MSTSANTNDAVGNATTPNSNNARQPKRSGKKKGCFWGFVAIAIIAGAIYYFKPTPPEIDPHKHTFSVDGVEFKMVFVEGGTFLMGATPDQVNEAFSVEKPAHEVTVDDFYIGETEVTQKLWKEVMGIDPSYDKGFNKPVEQVSWDDCQVFVRKLNRLTGKTFRLPTEAEWEYATRGGKKSLGYKFSGSIYLDDVAWWSDNSDGTTHAIKQKRPNELGIYDMAGNVSEWCQDYFDFYNSSPQRNPTGLANGELCVVRGGSYCTDEKNSRVSCRGFLKPSIRHKCIGLRLAMKP